MSELEAILKDIFQLNKTKGDLIRIKLKSLADICLNDFKHIESDDWGKCISILFDQVRNRDRDGNPRQKLAIISLLLIFKYTSTHIQGNQEADSESKERFNINILLDKIENYINDYIRNSLYMQAESHGFYTFMHYLAFIHPSLSRYYSKRMTKWLESLLTEYRDHRAAFPPSILHNIDALGDEGKHRTTSIEKLKSIDSEQDNIPHIISVHSLKGGVGKSLVSATLARKLSNKKKRVCVIDLDFHGPSQLFLLNDDKSYSSLIDSGTKYGNSFIDYMDLSDYYKALLLTYDRKKELRLAEKYSNELPVKGAGYDCILLSHNANDLPDIARFTRNEDIYNDFLARLGLLINCLKNKYDIIVIDAPPGLYAHHGQLIYYISKNLKGIPVFISSPNNYDILGTVYDMAFFLGKSELAESKPLWIGNLWPVDANAMDPVEAANRLLDNADNGSECSKVLKMISEEVPFGYFTFPDSPKNSERDWGDLVSYAYGTLFCASLPISNELRQISNACGISNNKEYGSKSDQYSVLSVWERSIGKVALHFLKRWQ